MSIYYIKTLAGDIFTLDATESFEFSENGSLTEYTIESGAKVSDHYVNENKSISISGIISDFKSARSTNAAKDTGDFIHKILKLKGDREPFKVYYRGGNVGNGDNSKPNGDAYFDNVMFESVKFSQDSGVGSAKGRYAYRVDFQFKQITFSTRATITRENVIGLKSSEKKVAVAVNTLPAFMQEGNLKAQKERGDLAKIQSRPDEGYIRNEVVDQGISK